MTVLNHRTDDSAALRERLGEVQATLETERNQHAATRRLLSEQHAATQAMQTRLAHAELAHTEAQAQQLQARAVAQEALAEALAKTGAAGVRKSRVIRAKMDVAAAADGIDGPDMTDAVDAPAEVAVPEIAVRNAEAVAPATFDGEPANKRGRGRPRTAPPKEPKPVRWWTPSFLNKTR